MLKGGKTGPSIVPGDAENSLLIRAIRQTGSTLKMPQGGKLKDAEIEDIVAWVNAGAIWPKAAAEHLRQRRRQVCHRSRAPQLLVAAAAQRSHSRPP